MQNYQHIKTTTKQLASVCAKTRPRKVHHQFINKWQRDMVITHFLVLHHMIWQMIHQLWNPTLLHKPAGYTKFSTTWQKHW